MRDRAPAASNVLGQPRSPLRWLAIPAAIIVFVLVGLAASTEDRDEFEERAGQNQPEQSEPEQDQQPDQGEPDEGQRSDRQRDQGQPSEGQPGGEQPEQQGRDTVIVSTENGDVVVQLDENGQPVALVPVDATGSGNIDDDFYVPSETGRVIVPGPDGDVAGIRVTTDGQLEIVASDEIANEDFLFQETADRVVLLRPDGSTILLEPSTTFDLIGTERSFDRKESPAIKLSNVVLERTGVTNSASLKAETPPDHPGVTIGTTDGAVRFDLDREGNLIAHSSLDGVATDIPSESEPVLIDTTGLRVTELGQVEALEPSDTTRPDDYTISAEGNVIELVRPDGQRILITPQPNENRLDAKRVSSEGSANLRSRKTILVTNGSDLPSDSKIDEDAEPLAIQTDDGIVRLDFDKDGNLVADQPNRNDIIVLDPTEPSAIRVDENGEFEVIPLDELNPDDIVVQPDGEGGFDLVRPDGSRVEFRPDGENDGMTATEISPDGTETELAPNEDGSVTLEDGTEIGAIDQPEDSGPIESFIESTSEIPWLWLLGGLSLLAALSIGTATYLYLNRPDDPFDYSQLISPGQIPRDRFEEFLSMLQADSDPTRAVRLGFAAAENGLGGIPRKRFTETPFEWQERVASVAVHKAETVETICDLFARARFAPGDSLEEDRSAMIRWLRILNNQDAAHVRPDGPIDKVNEPA